MKKIIVLLLALLFSVTSFAQGLSAVYDYKMYCTDQLEPYMQVNFFINGTSVIYQKNDEGKYAAQVNISVKLYEDTTVISHYEHILLSEAFDDSIAANKPSFADIKNFKIPGNGRYILFVSMRDVNDTLPPSELAEYVSAHTFEDAITISDITILSTLEKAEPGDLFNKYGYNTFPVFFGDVPEEMATLPFYFEIYNADKVIGKDKSCLLKIYVEDDYTRQLALPSLYTESGITAEKVKVVVNQLGIFQLPSGKYNLVAEVWDDTLLMARSRESFVRDNPRADFNIDSYQSVDITGTFVDQFTDSATFYQNVAYLYPIASPNERNFFDSKLAKTSFDKLRRYFYSFWLTRDPDAPEAAWNRYYKNVQYVNNTFGGAIFQGYRTDRGRVFLQYGAPDDYTEYPYDSHSYPYEIWHYYHLESQTNVKFVFYNPDLVSKDYELIHSNKYGELQDPFWQLRVANRKDPIFNFDNPTPGNYWGGSVQDAWKYH